MSMTDEVMRRPLTSAANEEINARAEQRKQLLLLSGFGRFTSVQQNIIFASTYVQNLAHRHAREGGFGKASTFQERWWCAKTVHNLETEQAIKVNKRDTIPKEFYEAAYATDAVDKQMSRVKAFGYPCVVFLTEQLAPGKDFPIHITLVAGEDEKGEVWAWDKYGSAPFALVPLQNIIAKCDVYCTEKRHKLSVGIRKVRCLKSAEHPDGVIEPERPAASNERP